MVDWQTWSSWDKGQESVHFPGPLAAGSVGELKLKDGPKVALRITDLNAGQSYTSEFRMLGATFVFEHEVFRQADEVSNIRFAVSSSGWFAPFVGYFVNPKIVEGLPKWMANFQKIVEA
jgi:hypothetical protein